MAKGIDHIDKLLLKAKELSDETVKLTKALNEQISVIRGIREQERGKVTDESGNEPNVLYEEIKQFLHELSGSLAVLVGGMDLLPTLLEAVERREIIDRILNDMSEALRDMTHSVRTFHKKALLGKSETQG